MRFIDSHTHAWGANSPELPWKAEVLPPEWEGPYPFETLIADMDRIGIDESVIVTTPLYGRGVRANEYTMRAISAYPDRFYGVGLMPYFEAPETMRANVRRVVGHERMLGVRMHAPFVYDEIPAELDPTADWILDDDLDPVWETLADAGKAMFVFPKSEQLSAVKELATRHPETTIVIDHMAWPDETTDPDARPWTEFERLAENPNVFVKVSSLPRSAQSDWPYPDLHGYVQHLIDWFGPERLMLGSDYPWMDRWASYEDCLSWIQEVDFLSARDLSYLSYRTFDRVHG